MEIKQLSEIDPEQANIEYVDLMNKCFNLNLKYTNRLFIKKHIENPFGQSYGNFIYKDGQLIATNLNLRWEFILKGKIIKAVQAVDGQVHPDFQRQGIFRKGQEASMQVTPSELLRFGFPNSKSKQGFLQWGWKLSYRYVTKIYPTSWMKFIRKRVIANRKDFKPQYRDSITNILENKVLFTKFLDEITKKNTTNFSHELLTWKLSLNSYLNAKLFKRDNKIIALLLYSTSKIDNYSLMVIFDLLKLDDVEFQFSIKREIKNFVKENFIDEVQYTGTDHNFLEQIFTPIKSKNADMILYPNYGNRNDIFCMQKDIVVSKFVTDHL
jgi:hypothetical protein